MSTDWEAEADALAAALEDEGTPCIVRSQSVTSFNPQTGDRVTAQVDTPAFGLFLSQKDWLAGSSDVQAEDRVFLVQAVGDSTPGGHLIAGGTWRIVARQPISPAGIPLAFKLLLRA